MLSATNIVAATPRWWLSVSVAIAHANRARNRYISHSSQDKDYFLFVVGGGERESDGGGGTGCVRPAHVPRKSALKREGIDCRCSLRTIL